MVLQCVIYLLVLGARFSDRVIGKAKAFANNAKIVHIDVDPSEINKNIKADASIIGDMKEVLIRLNSALTTTGSCRLDAGN